MTTTTSTSTTTIRLFEDDYDAFARVHNAVYTDFAQTAEEFRYEDGRKPERLKQQRWVAERDGRIVAYADYHQHAGIFDPHKFAVEIGVEPDYLLQGIGSALYRTVIEALRPFEPTTISAWCRGDMFCFVRFLGHRGFEETMRMWVSILDLTTFDPRPFAKHARIDDGIEVKTRGELASDPDLFRKLYDLWCEVRQDIPMPPGEVRVEMPFEEWLSYEEHPSNLEDGYFIALADGQPVGVSSLWLSLDDPELLRTGLTGVRRAYRRRGIAFALKLRALEYARQRAGVKRVITDNASLNRPMLAINEALGFAKQPAWVHYAAEWAAASRGR
jgi:GNAT superfamily N-acetyltransferase